MDLNLGDSVWVGLAATGVMTVVMYALPVVGLPRTDVTLILGSMLRLPRNRAPYYGALMHFGMGVVFAFLYAFAFLILDVRPNWWIGLLAGIVHWALVMLAMDPFGDVHREIQAGRMKPPGLFMSNLGAEYAAASLVRHLVFGGMVGALFNLS